MKMWENVNIKLAKYLEPLLEVPSADQFHWWFFLMIDTKYVNESKDVIKMHEIETVDTRTIMNEMMPNLYDYIVAAYLAENPYKVTPAVTTSNFPFISIFVFSG